MSGDKPDRYWYRVSFVTHREPIPSGFHVHHSCRNGWCLNPQHLSLMTPAEHSRLHAEQHEVGRRLNPDVAERTEFRFDLLARDEWLCARGPLKIALMDNHHVLAVAAQLLEFRGSTGNIEYQDLARERFLKELDDRGIRDQLVIRTKAWLGGPCHCGRKGIYRFGLRFFCSAHRAEAQSRRRTRSFYRDKQETLRARAWKEIDEVNQRGRGDLLAMKRRAAQVKKLQAMRHIVTPDPPEPQS